MKIQAMVLAAGLGTRLWPLTADRAKPAVPFLRKPLVAWALELLHAHGVRDVVVNTHHRPESIVASIPSHLGLAARISHEPKILGTAGALAKARDDGLLDPARDTLILNAKLFTDIDVSAVVAAHEAAGSHAAVTMVLRPNPGRERFREVLVDADRVIGFGETAVPAGPKPLLFTGIHLVSKEVLCAIPSGCALDTVRDIYPTYIRSRRVLAHFDSSSRWWEFSTLARYVDLHRSAWDEGLGANAAISPGANVHPDACLDNVIVWERAWVPRDVVLADVVVGAGVVLPSGSSFRRKVVVRREFVGGSTEFESVADLAVFDVDARHADEGSR